MGEPANWKQVCEQPDTERESNNAGVWSSTDLLTKRVDQEWLSISLTLAEEHS